MWLRPWTRLLWWLTLILFLAACSSARATVDPLAPATPSMPPTGVSAQLVPTPTSVLPTAPVPATPSPSSRAPDRPSVTVAPAAPTAAPSTTKRAPRRDGRLVLAYYVPYDPTSWASLEAHADQIDIVATQTVFLNLCGDLTTQDDLTLISFAASHGIQVVPSVFTTDPTVNHRILTDSATSAHTIRVLTDYVVELGYAGLDVDLENVAPADRSALTAFVSQLSQALHQRGKLITMAVPAKDHDVLTGWAGPYDYAALAPSVDLVTIMSYEYSSPNGPPGPIAPYSWVDRVIGFAASQFSRAKVLLGVPFYGYDWNASAGGRARALRYSQAAALAQQYGTTIGFDPATRSATFRYVARPGDPLPADDRPPTPHHDLRRQVPPSCAIPTPTPRPTAPPATPVPRAGQHVVWLENAQSSVARLQLATQHGTAGVGMWRLGQEDPAVWSALAAWRAGQAP